MLALRRATRLRLGALSAAVALLASLPSLGVSRVAPAEAATAYCGATVLKPNGTPWACSFADEFSGNTLDTSKWTTVTTAQGGFSSGGECYLDRRENVAVTFGTLRLTVRQERQPVSCSSPYGTFSTPYTGGYVSTWNKFSQAYGRYEIRARFPSVTTSGVHSALWLYPVTLKYGAWPASGEIDIAEYFSKYPDRVVPYLHYRKGATDANVTNTKCMITPSLWHNYSLEWTPTSITIKYDGNVCLSTTAWYPDNLSMPAPFDHPYTVNLTQALGNGLNPFSATTTKLPATMYVDYVRIWH